MTTVAIDFGTSNTVVAVLDPDTTTPRTLHLGAIARRFTHALGDTVPIVPTLVYVQDDHTVLLGEQVRSQRLQYKQPGRAFMSFKRGLAADFSPPPRQIGDRSHDSEAITQHFLDGVWAQVLAQGIEPTQLILTVPVGAFERYLGCLQQWSRTLTVADVQFVDESTAAALGYGLKTAQTVVLVIDWGGGTLDLSLVRLQLEPTANLSRAQVIAKADAYLGGEDIDQAIATTLFPADDAKDATTTALWAELAERLKVRLSQVDRATDSWLDERTFTAYDLSLNRDRLAQILEEQGFLGQLRDSLDEVLRLALMQGIAKTDIAQVVMVGGTCLIPAIQELVVAYFGRSRVKVEQPFTAVSHGALALTQIPTVQDYLQHSYAIRLWEPSTQGYAYLTLFAKGTQYPCLRPDSLTLQVAQDGQAEIRLDIGEIADSQQTEVAYDDLGRMMSKQRSQPSAYRALQRRDAPVCLAHLDPQGVAGQDRIQVDFEVDTQRMLRATVRDLLTQKVLVDRGAIVQLE